MTKYNCIVVLSPDESQVLFCKRTKEPFLGQYNFVGGRVEEGESDEAAAYRELFEETGIRKEDISPLKHFMDLTYYDENFVLELYRGVLKHEVELIPEKHPLEWLVIETEDFADPVRFAGRQNIAHIMNVALQYLHNCE